MTKVELYKIFSFLHEHTKYSISDISENTGYPRQKVAEVLEMLDMNNLLDVERAFYLKGCTKMYTKKQNIDLQKLMEYNIVPCNISDPHIDADKDFIRRVKTACVKHYPKHIYLLLLDYYEEELTDEEIQLILDIDNDQLKTMRKELGNICKKELING